MLWLKHLLSIIGAGTVIVAIGLAWIAWRDKRDRRRYLAEQAKEYGEL